MVASWVKRDFSGAGVTQYPPGPQLAAVTAHYLGYALLCIDVSGSMYGHPLKAAIEGGLDFLDEAELAGYRCGLVLWHHDVEAHLPTTTKQDEVRSRLRSACAGGGNQLDPTIRIAIDELGPLKGDRVVCVFGDGDVGDVHRTEKAAAQARALGIRFVVRGLGSTASSGLAAALQPDGEAAEQTIDDVAGMRRGIASMAQEMRRGHAGSPRHDGRGDRSPGAPRPPGAGSTTEGDPA